MSKESSHWYDIDGKAVFEVPNKSKGGRRPTRITDAIAMGLLPSVTTILNVLNKPQLEDWKHKQITKAAFERLGDVFDTHEMFHEQVVDAAFQQVTDAADLGTRIHKAIEDHFQGRDYDAQLAVYVRAVDAWVKSNGIAFANHELRLVSKSHGYAGTTDAVFLKHGALQNFGGFPPSTGILDFKSRKTKPGEPCSAYDTQAMQISAYHVANFHVLPEDNHIGCNVFISTTEPGRVEAVWYTPAELRAAWHAFAACRDLWIYLKGYDPR